MGHAVPHATSRPFPGIFPVALCGKEYSTPITRALPFPATCCTNGGQGRKPNSWKDIGYIGWKAMDLFGGNHTIGNMHMSWIKQGFIQKGYEYLCPFYFRSANGTLLYESGTCMSHSFWTCHIQDLKSIFGSEAEAESTKKRWPSNLCRNQFDLWRSDILSQPMRSWRKNRGILCLMCPFWLSVAKTATSFTKLNNTTTQHLP